MNWTQQARHCLKPFFVHIKEKLYEYIWNEWSTIILIKWNQMKYLLWTRKNYALSTVFSYYFFFRTASNRKYYFEQLRNRLWIYLNGENIEVQLKNQCQIVSNTAWTIVRKIEKNLQSKLSIYKLVERCTFTQYPRVKNLCSLKIDSNSCAEMHKRRKMYNINCEFYGFRIKWPLALHMHKMRFIHSHVTCTHHFPHARLTIVSCVHLLKLHICPQSS